MRTLAFWIIVLHVATVLLCNSPAEAQAPEFAFVSESAVFNPATGHVLFTIEFNQAPDFWSADVHDRQHHSFQHFIDGDTTLPYPANYDSIVRAEEIHYTVDTIRVRSPDPSEPHPPSGGWGPIRAEVPFQLHGRLLTFSVPLTVLSDHSRDGHFSYEIMSAEYGGGSQFVRSQSIVALESEIDIKPNSRANRINPDSHGAVTVAIITTNAFDAMAIDPESVRFGGTGAEATPVHYSVRDVDRDGDSDIVLRFETAETGIHCGMTSASLMGQTTGGQFIAGVDSIRVTGCH